MWNTTVRTFVEPCFIETTSFKLSKCELGKQSNQRKKHHTNYDEICWNVQQFSQCSVFRSIKYLIYVRQTKHGGGAKEKNVQTFGLPLIICSTTKDSGFQSVTHSAIEGSPIETLKTNLGVWKLRNTGWSLRREFAKWLIEGSVAEADVAIFKWSFGWWSIDDLSVDQFGQVEKTRC